MIEPIKLPPDLLAWTLVREGINKHRARDIECWMNEKMTQAVEQATTELRAECDALQQIVAGYPPIEAELREVSDRAFRAEAERETPRTDAELVSDPYHEWVRSSFARQLERELSAALVRAEKAEAELSEQVRCFKNDAAGDQVVFDTIVAERDAALARLAHYETLRPASEHRGELAAWYLPNGGGFFEASDSKFRKDGCLWTPLPDVKEPAK